ncbi:MAG: C-type lectin domain-containing protein [Bacteroidota bacterium]
MPPKIILSFRLLLSIATLLATMDLGAQTTLWSENFSSYTDGATSGTASGASSSSWALSPGDDAEVDNFGGSRQIRAANTNSGTDTETWSTATIDITGYTDVVFRFDAAAIATGSENFESNDYFRFDYRVDGGTWIRVMDASGTSGDPVGSYASSPGDISDLGTTLELRAIFYNTQNAENYTLDNVLVEGTSDNPPSITGTGDQIYCPGTSLAIAETVNITDTDDTTAEAIQIQISSGYVSGEDLLTLSGTHPSITSSWDPIQGELTLQGPATFTAFEAAILATQYSSSSPTPSGARTFSITVGTANYLPSTQHYYEFVSSPGISWTAARDAAATRSYFGLQGYLATLTSQEEADFSGEQSSGFGWIGASDAAVEGEWRWVTGPESGTLFWNGTAGGTEITFANWNSGEPNNAGNEDYAHIADPSVISGGAPIGSWNDLPNPGGGGAYVSQGYVVEYGGSPGDPTLNITITTTVTMDNVAPTWDTAVGSLDAVYACPDDFPSPPSCTGMNTGFNEDQYYWRFYLQDNVYDGVAVPQWEVRILGANYTLNAGDLTNPSAYNYTMILNGDGTYDHIFKGTTSLADGVWFEVNLDPENFASPPTSSAFEVYCGEPYFPEPVASDNCGGTLTITKTNDVTTGTVPTDFVRAITYVAEDVLGNQSPPFVQTITVTLNAIADQPDDLTVYSNNPASFTVVDPSADTYQWQVSTDGGTTFIDLTDGGGYSGTQTATLSLSGSLVQMPLNNNRFRVLVSHSGSYCAERISEVALLNIRPGSVVTNRGITYRINQ